jgi:WD40 repeat protein
MAANSAAGLWSGPRRLPWGNRPSGNPITGIRLSSDGSLLLYLDAKRIRLFETKTGELIQKTGVRAAASTKWARSRERIALCWKRGMQINLEDTAGNATCTIHCDLPANDLAFSPSDELIAIVNDRQLEFRRTESGALVSMRELNSPGSAIDFSHDGSLLACGGQSEGVLVFNPANSELCRELRGGRGIESLTFSPDDSLIAAGDQDGLVRVWETHTGRLRAEFAGHEKVVRDIAFSPDGRTLISASADSVRLWCVENGRSYGVLCRPGVHGCSISLSADGNHFAVGFRNKDGVPEVLMWDRNPESVY